MPNLDLAAALGVLYPAAVLPFDYSVVDAGDGPTIVQWNETKLGPIPADDAIAVAALTAIKRTRCITIDVVTEAIVAQGFAFGGVTFALDTKSILKLTALYSFRDRLTFPMDLTTLDNAAFTVPDITTFEALCGVAMGTATAIEDAGRTLKVAINAATDTAGVNAVVDTR